VILRGVNVNALAEYWKGTRFPDDLPVGARDPRRLRAFGWNAIRLLVSWSRIEPRPGRYDERYLTRVRATAARLISEGLYVFVDFHQDAWGPTLAAREGETCPAGSTPALGWDGAPGWATLVGDDVPRCAVNGTRELSPRGANGVAGVLGRPPGPGGVGVQRRFLRAVAHTVERVGRGSGIAGYDILNEPNAFGAAENAALSRMYGGAVRAIRAAERRVRAPRRMILFEPSALWSETGSGAPPTSRGTATSSTRRTSTPGRQRRSLSPQAFETALAEARGFGGAPVLTGEWGAARGRLDYFQAHLDLQDQFGMSSTQWTWRESCGDPHQRGAALAGTVATGTYAVWGVDCADNRVLGIGADLTGVLTRGYVRAAPGRLSSVRWDVQGQVLDAAGAQAREGVVLEAVYPGRGSVSATGLRRVRAASVPGGELVTAAARGATGDCASADPTAKQRGEQSVSTDDLRERRLAVVREPHGDENRHDFDATMADLRPSALRDRADRVTSSTGRRRSPSTTGLSREAFPDQRNENTTLHAADDAVIAEFDLLGTHQGELRGIRTDRGAASRCRMCAIFEFPPGSDRIVCERVYFDQATLARPAPRGGGSALGRGGGVRSARREAIADPDRPPGDDVGAQPAAVDQGAQDAAVVEALQVRARLAQATAAAARLAERELASDQRVEIDPAHDDVAAVVDVPAECVEHRRVHERQGAPGLARRRTSRRPRRSGRPPGRGRAPRPPPARGSPVPLRPARGPRPRPRRPHVVDRRGRPGRDVQRRHDVPVDHLVRRARRVPDRPRRHAEHHDRPRPAAVAGRTPRDPRARPS
jgi:endoglycosylceramidase